jgi:hypothetical protein
MIARILESIQIIVIFRYMLYNDRIKCNKDGENRWEEIDNDWSLSNTVIIRSN